MQKKKASTIDYRNDRFYSPIIRSLEPIRKEMGYSSQAEFGEDSGIGGRALIGQLENGAVSPSRDCMSKLLTFLDNVINMRPELGSAIRRIIHENLIDPKNDWALFQYPTFHECELRYIGFQLPSKPNLEAMAFSLPFPYRFFIDVAHLSPEAYKKLDNLSRKMEDANVQQPLSFQMTSQRQFVASKHDIEELRRCASQDAVSKSSLAFLERLDNNGLLFCDEALNKKATDFPTILQEYQNFRLNNWAARQNGPAAVLTSSDSVAQKIFEMNYQWPLSCTIRILYFDVSKNDGFFEWTPKKFPAEKAKSKE